MCVLMVRPSSVCVCASGETNILLDIFMHI